VAEQLADRIVSLPMHPALTDADIDYVLDQITHPRNDGR
jgi:dTDP-4-amino-4,6-dideoxygalactose transaminase